MTQIGRDPRYPITDRQRAVLAIYLLRPHDRLPKRKGDLRIFPDGSRYRVTRSGWRRIPQEIPEAKP